ncbi:MAG: hypothetical protein BMS9Abin07_0887 [Acidimicrobiia bacterium]|nr:MAG: hypothetical protein BMS9Abin07_0887 [Acidimicrobiia bacterium]
MTPRVSKALLDRAAEWDELHRWERSELGKKLRRLGLTYGEIRELVPVPKGTLSYWCRDIRLSEDQVEAIRRRTGPETRVGIPVDTQWRRREEIDRIRKEARSFAEDHVDDPFFVAGVVLYWGEGAKTGSDLSLANADPRAIRLLIAWVRHYLDKDAEFVLKVNLHADNDEPAARYYWAAESGLPSPAFYKTFIKPDGTGHRKNQLRHGVCMVRMRRCADAWNATMAWIDVVADGQSFPRAAR